MKTKTKPTTIIQSALAAGVRTAAELARFLRRHHQLMGEGR